MMFIYETYIASESDMNVKIVHMECYHNNICYIYVNKLKIVTFTEST